VNKKLIATLAACGLATAVLADEAELKPAASAKTAGEAKPKGIAAASAKPKVPAKADVQDLVFLNNGKLLRFRVYITVDGKAASQAWEAFVDKIFAFYDRNNDKFLSPQEAARVPPPQVFGQGINLLFNGRGGRGNVNFAQMDTNKDGKVSIDEFRAYARQSGFSPVSVLVLPPSGAAQQLTDAFYKHVNTKNDGKLTKADLAAAWEKLSRLDADEDEIITAQELRAQPMNPYAAEPVAVYGGMGGPQQIQQSPFIALPAGGTEAAVAALMARFDAEKRSFVPGTEMRFGAGIPKVARDSLRNAEVEYLRAFLAQPVDLEVTATLGTISQGVSRLMSFGTEPAYVKATRTDGKAAPLESAAKVGADGLLRVTLPDSLIECGRAESANQFDGTAQYYLQQFKMAAGDKKYLEKADLMGNPQLQFFVNVFDDLDRNGDGKLTVAELQAGFDLLEAGSKSQVFLTIVDQGRGIFDLIDTNHDSRLSRRELLNALKKFDELDKNKDGVIERTELPAQFRITASQGQSNGQVRTVVFNPYGQTTPRTASTKGPLWFRKMDRNGDGDVSEREFLGTPEEFKLIDTDGDGLISVQEAERYEALKKQKTASK
jgi:Ca2+-binding EF-hand superfamily protein